ncbi:hypothetical protein C8R43DRAFT_1155752 [Mycena crocata]|nr:hypothetical protein C8R43DRAFT_1155752 [Mycena crocata]
MTPLAAILAGMTVGIFLYGVHFTLFLASTYLLVKRFIGAEAGPLYRSMMFISAAALFVSMTTNCILLAARVYIGFLIFADGPVAFFIDQRQPTALALNVFSLLSIALNDSMMIYRLWAVWCHNKVVVILPILSFIGLVVASFLIVIDIRSESSIALVVSLTPTFVFTLVTNIYCTAFIFWQLWRVTKVCMPVGGTNLRDLLAMLVESSALYTAWAIFYTITHQINSNTQYIAVATFPSVAGISNALLQARIGMGRTVEPPTSAATQPVRFVVRTGGTTAGTSREDDFEMKPAAI